MAVVEPIYRATREKVRNGQVMGGIAQTGSIRTVGGFGNIRLGHTKYGINIYIGGVYQRRWKQGKPIYVKMKYYRPTDPKTPTQQANRARMAAAVAAWQALSEAEKQEWRRRGHKQRRRGYNLYIKDFLC